MFGFNKKQAAPATTEAQVKAANVPSLPEECALLTDCEFAEVSGGNVSKKPPPMNL